jgi:hypothetical protein
MMKKLLILVSCLIAAVAIGQAVPFGPITPGAVWTTTQWNQAWASKQDVVSGGTRFTVSGCGTAGNLQGGSTAGFWVVGTGASSCTFVITMGGLTATHGWTCSAYDVSRALPLAQSAVGPQTCTITSTINGTPNQVFTTDFITFQATGY